MPRLPGASFSAAVLMAPETPATLPLDVDDVLAGLLLAGVAVLAVNELLFVPTASVEEVLVELVESAVSVWLIEINCSRLFTFTNWLMYSLGSVSAVGSWFFISVTSRVRKSLAEIVAELLVVVLELLVTSAFAVVPLAAAVAD